MRRFDTAAERDASATSLLADGYVVRDLDWSEFWARESVHGHGWVDGHPRVDYPAEPGEPSYVPPSKRFRLNVLRPIDPAWRATPADKLPFPTTSEVHVLYFSTRKGRDAELARLVADEYQGVAENWVNGATWQVVKRILAKP